VHRNPGLAKAVAPLVVGGLVGVLLTGCVPGLGRNSVPSESPTPGQSSSSASSAAASVPATTVAQTSSPGASTTVAADAIKPLPDYTGPKAMPASDGKPMLWPVPTTVSMTDYGYPATVERYGFLDVNAKLVVPQRYESYQYCPDESGRPVLLILTRDSQARAEVFDLTGKRLATLPTNGASCAGPDYVITTKDGLDEASTRKDVQNGLFELATGKLVIAMIKGRQLTSLRPGLLNVTEPKGEYFLNLDTGRKTRHPGWIPEWISLTPGAPGLPATTKRDAGRSGFLDLSGNWIVPPTLIDARAFAGILAVIEPKRGTLELVDTNLSGLAGEWTQIDEVSRTIGAFDGYRTVGYLATSAVGQALFNADGKLLIPPGAGGIECSYEAAGACSLSLAIAGEQLVTLPAGTRTDLPAGFHSVINGSFFGSSRPGEDGGNERVYSLASGKTIETPQDSACTGAGPAFVVCGSNSDVGPAVVIDADGPTAFASVAPLAEPDDSGDVAYYRVTTAKFIGIVDASGAWRYRQSSYTRLDD